MYFAPKLSASKRARDPNKEGDSVRTPRGNSRLVCKLCVGCNYYVWAVNERLSVFLVILKFSPDVAGFCYQKHRCSIDLIVSSLFTDQNGLI